MIYDTCENIVISNKSINDFKNFEFELIRYFSVTTELDSDDFESMSEKEITDKIYTIVLKHFPHFLGNLFHKEIFHILLN